MDELREAREQGENMSRKLNQDLEDRCVELQDAREQITALEGRLQEARTQEQESINRYLLSIIYQLMMQRISPRSSSEVSGQEIIL